MLPCHGRDLQSSNLARPANDIMKNKKKEPSPRTLLELSEIDLVDYFTRPKGLRLGCNPDIYDRSNTIQNNKPNIFKYGGYRD